MASQAFPTTSAAYMQALHDVFFSYDHLVKGGGTRFNDADFYEKLNYSFTIKEPKVGTPETKSDVRNDTMKAYAAAETPLFDAGNLNEDGAMERLSKIWGRIKNPDGTINANYA